jgi:hypothetical protein
MNHPRALLRPNRPTSFTTGPARTAFAASLATSLAIAPRATRPTRPAVRRTMRLELIKAHRPIPVGVDLLIDLLRLGRVFRHPRPRLELVEADGPVRIGVDLLKDLLRIRPWWTTFAAASGRRPFPFFGLGAGDPERRDGGDGKDEWFHDVLCCFGPSLAGMNERAYANPPYAGVFRGRL